MLRNSYVKKLTLLIHRYRSSGETSTYNNPQSTIRKQISNQSMYLPHEIQYTNNIETNFQYFYMRMLRIYE